MGNPFWLHIKHLVFKLALKLQAMLAQCSFVLPGNKQAGKIAVKRSSQGHNYTAIMRLELTFIVPIIGTPPHSTT